MIKLLFVNLFLLLPLFLSAQEVDLLILNNEYDKALQLIDEKLSADETQSMLHLKKGIILQRQFNYTGAMKSLLKAYQQDSLNPSILAEIADLNSSLGDHKTALTYLKILYNHDTTNTVKVLKLARGYSNLRIYDRPFKILKSAYERDSSNLIINKNLALCATLTGQNDLAISLYPKIIKRNPNDLANYLNLASAYQSKKMDSSVIGTLELGLLAFPDHQQLLMKLGDFQFQAENYPRAAIVYEKLFSSGDSTRMRNMGICCYFEKQPEKGTYLLGKSLKQIPNDPIAALYLGLCYQEIGELNQSIEWLKFAAEISVPEYLTNIYQHLSYVYGLNKEYRKAIPALQKAYENSPSKSDILFQIATIYENLKDSKPLSLKYYDNYLKAVKLDSTASKKYIEYAFQRRKILKEEIVNKNIKPAGN